MENKRSNWSTKLSGKVSQSIKRAFIELLLKNAVKFYITVDITMVRKDKEGFKERTTTFFHGSTRILLRASQIPEILQASAEKISESFDEFLRNG